MSSSHLNALYNPVSPDFSSLSLLVALKNKAPIRASTQSEMDFPMQEFVETYSCFSERADKGITHSLLSGSFKVFM